MVLAFVALTSQVEAFWGTVHLPITREAEANYPDALKAALAELDILVDFYYYLVQDKIN